METDLPETSRYQVKPLSTENYFLWSNKMEVLLRGKGLWEIVIGDEMEPRGDDAALKKFRIRRDRATTCLLMSIEERCLPSVISLRDPRTNWLRLEETYQKISQASIDAYLLQYQELRMANGEKIMEFVNRLQDIEKKLIGIGKLLSEDDKRRCLLRSLRPDFAVTAEVIRGTDKSIADAIFQLLVFEASQIQEGKSDETVSLREKTVRALAASSVKECHHRGRLGHVKATCFHNPKSKSYRKNGFSNGYNHRGHTEDREMSRVYTASML